MKKQMVKKKTVGERMNNLFKWISNWLLVKS